ncbi:hypothetical protein CRP01_40505 [Flavilitoribacter nigricans DSM 23189 = NBRC 102662]|uniref:Uncharacterized protein n=1 Tax=Flavilitoribacter nigricans (strain ATCC 23147 / DSM 23189 / NBRC 102662 / NCIMB 1420 / SS-2) TaxID=1122177 RepID=A0A2D0MY18_FLAN2|nr:hypothetical protein CRP01_40505 [Flavilitoribacter nigricans DSM 23189 = NBRC 102662]
MQTAFYTGIFTRNKIMVSNVQMEMKPTPGPFLFSGKFIFRKVVSGNAADVHVDNSPIARISLIVKTDFKVLQ